ncbi:hypothetical protein TYRP_005084 [Tyrophagus putrescentiae]|nr:hypothetical protein TYRP_005084 [Tyrophagus putrescentiae]
MLILNRQSLTWLDHCQRPSPRALLAALAGPSSTDVESGQATLDLAVFSRALLVYIDHFTGGSPDIAWPLLCRALLGSCKHLTVNLKRGLATANARLLGPCSLRSQDPRRRTLRVAKPRVLGNVMVVIVVLRSRGMRTPTNCYLVSLAIADSMVLLASVPNGIIAYYILGDKWIWGRVGCALFIFFQFLGINASSLSIAAFTVERYIAICHPMLAHKLCTVRRAKRIILYVWMFATAYCSPWLFLTKVEPLYYIGIEAEVVTCKFALNREHYKGYFLTDMVLFYIIPLLVSVVLYALIARILYQNDIFRRNGKGGPLEVGTGGGNQAGKLSSSTSGLMPPLVTSGMPHHHHQSSNHHSNSVSVNLNSNSSITRHYLTTTTTTSTSTSTTTYGKCQLTKKNASSSSDASRVQVVKMLAVVVAVFATLWLPYRALVVYNSFTFPPYMELWYLMFAKTMIFVNSAINPIIYSACSIKFRREFKRMLTCNRKPSYYYSRSGHGRMGGNGTTVSGATEMYFGDGTTGLRVNRSGGGGGGGAVAAFRAHSGSAQLHYSSVSNLATTGIGGRGCLAASSALSGSRRESDFLSPSHALIGRFESKGGQKNGSILRTSASIGSRLTAAAAASVTATNENIESGNGSCSRSNSKSEGLGGGGGERERKPPSVLIATSNTNIALDSSTTIKTTTSITLIYNNDTEIEQISPVIEHCNSICSPTAVVTIVKNMCDGSQLEQQQSCEPSAMANGNVMLCDHLDIDCLCEHQSIVIEVPLPLTSATGASTELKNQKSHQKNHLPPLPDRHNKARKTAAAAIAFQEPLEAIGLEQLKATTRGGRFVAVENNVSAEVLSQMEKQKNKEEVVVEMEFDQPDSLEEEEEEEEDNEEDNEEEEEETEQSDHQAAFQPIDSSLLMKDSEMPMLGGESGCKSCQIVAAGQTSLMSTSTADRQLISTEHGQQLNSHSSESNNKNTDDGVEGSGDRPQFTASPSADESKLHLPLESLTGEEEEKEFVSSKQQEEKEEEKEENEEVVAIEDETLSPPPSPHSCSACAARAAHGQLQLKKEYLSQDPLISIDAARAHFEAAKSEDSEDDDGGGGIIDDEEDILKVAAERLAAIHAEAEDIWRADLEPVVTVVLEGALEDGAKMAGTVNQAVEAVVDEMVDKVADWSLVSLPDLLGKLATAPERLSARWSGQLGEAGSWAKREFWRWLTEGEEEYSLVEEVEVETEGGEVMVYKRSPLMRWLASMKVKAFSPPSPLPSPPKMIKEEQQQQLMNSSFYLLQTEDEKEKDKEEEERRWLKQKIIPRGTRLKPLKAACPLSPLKWWLKLMLKKALLPPLSPPVPSPEQQQPSPAEPAAELPLLPSPVKSPSPIKKKKRPLKKRKAKTTAAKVDGKKDLDTPGAEIETPSDLNKESAGQQQQQLCMDNQPKTTPLRWLAAVLKKALAPPPPPLPLSGTPLQTSSSLSEWPAVTGLSEEANH